MPSSHLIVSLLVSVERAGPVAVEIERSEPHGADPQREAEHRPHARAQRLEHIHILRTLAWIQERNLGRGAVTAEDALRTQGFPDRSLIGSKRSKRSG